VSTTDKTPGGKQGDHPQHEELTDRNMLRRGHRRLPNPKRENGAMTDIAATMREGLLAMAVSAGLAVMGALMEESVTALCGLRANMTPAAARSATGRRRVRDARRTARRRPPPPG